MKILIAAIFATALGSSAYALPVKWDVSSGGNNHTYDFVILADPISASDAEALAEASLFAGNNGYLATITSPTEQLFLNSIWPGIGSVTGQFEDQSFFLIGASDRVVEGDFRWLGGPEDGDALTYTNWVSGEPNNGNGNGDEDYVVAWWQDSSSGLWNDIPGSSSINAYVVEYDNAVAAVPLPASLPLMLGALGGLLAFRKRVSRST